MWPRRLNKKKASDAFTNKEISPIPLVNDHNGQAKGQALSAGLG
jgi:hypothetical protein